MFALNAFRIWIVGVLLYVMSVQAGGEMIKIFSTTNPTNTHSALCLVGGLILVIWPFVDGLAFLINFWRVKLGFKNKKNKE